MNYRLPFVCVFILVLSFQSSHSAIPRTPYSATFLSGLNRFSADFYETTARGKNGSFVSSPISALTVLAMLACGANGHTRDELVNAIHLPIAESNILLNFKQLFLDLKSVTDVELRLANKLFVRNEFEIEWFYKRISDVIFRSDIESLDFSDTDKAAKAINTWTKEKTEKRITDIVRAADFDDNTRLVVINAVYFKGRWVNSFKTAPDNYPFYLSENNHVFVPMMCNEVNYNYGLLSNINAQYVELPYETKGSKNKFSMFIILPNGVNEFDALAAHLGDVNFASLDAPRGKLRVCLPKFKVETELDLIPSLQNMGIHDMFGYNANFSNISPTEQLRVTKMIQKVFLSVNENGTKAASATGAVVSSRSMPLQLIVNRPFISALVLRGTGTPLFWARVDDPRSQSTN